MTYTHDTIYQRLLRQALKRNNLLNEEDLDIETRYTLEWVATELRALHAQQRTAISSIKKEILHRVLPAVLTRAVPGDAIVSAAPAGDRQIVKPEAVFTLANPSSGGKDGVYFSPCTETTLLNVQVKAMALGKTVVQFPATGEPEVAELPTVPVIPDSVIYLGLAIPESIPNPVQLSLYFDWQYMANEVKQKHAQCLPYIQWELDGIDLSSKPGFSDPEPRTSRHFDEEILLQSTLEQEAIAKYNDRFLQVSLPKDLDLNSSKRLWPTAWATIEADSVETTERLLWLKLYLPDHFQREHLTIKTNCFPVMNRKWVMENFTTDRTRRCLALGSGKGLAMDEYFLNVQSVHNHRIQFRPHIRSDYRKASLGSYRLVAGNIEKFNASNAREAILDLEHVLYEEALHFGLDSKAKPVLADLAKGFDKLESLRDKIPKRQAYWLYVTPEQESETIFTRYWTTQGENITGQCRAGAALQAEKKGNFKKDSIRLLSTPSGGRAPLNQSEQMDYMNFLLAQSAFREDTYTLLRTLIPLQSAG
ncbi:MAG: hypothetical protein AAF433_00170 [Bacteroidota bacterium]